MLSDQRLTLSTIHLLGVLPTIDSKSAKLFQEHDTSTNTCGNNKVKIIIQMVARMQNDDYMEKSSLSISVFCSKELIFDFIQGVDMRYF